MTSDLLRPHWFVGSALALSGAVGFRFAPGYLDGHWAMYLRLAALAAVSIGLFVVMRGVSRAAEQRPELLPNEIVRQQSGSRAMTLRRRNG